MPWVLYAKAIASVALLALAGLGFGRWIQRLLPFGFDLLDSLCFACLGGLGFLSTALFIAGQVAFTRPVIDSLTFIGAVLGLHWLFTLPEPGFQGLLAALRPAPLAAIIISIVLLITFFGGLAEMTGDSGQDGIAYHLHGPKLWLRQGVIRPMADTSNSAFPATNEVLFGALMAIGGERAPGFSALLTLVLFLLVLRSLALRIGLDQGYAWWVVALAATMPSVYAGLHSGFVDVFYAVLVLAAARVGFDAQVPRHSVAFGIFCGLAMASKYFGLVALPLLLVCSGIAGGIHFKPHWKATLANFLICASAACVLASPYYLRNWLLLGFPIFPPPPFAAGWIRQDYFGPGALAGYYAWIYKHGAGMGKSFGAFLLLPFHLTYHTANFQGAGGIGLTGLALGPLGVYSARRISFARAFALLGALLTVFWFYSVQESRYLIPVYAIGAVFAGLGWDYACKSGRRSSRALSAVVVFCSVLYGMFMIGSARAEALRAVFSPSFAERRREASIPDLQSFNYLNNNPEVKRVLIMDSNAPPYYLNKDYMKPIGQWGELTVPGVSSSMQELARAKADGITHVLDVNSEYSGFQVPQPAEGLELAFEAKDQRVYRVK